MKKYVVKGKFKMGAGWRPFERELDAGDELDAKERIFALLGGEHKCKRLWIQINDVKTSVGKEI